MDRSFLYNLKIKVESYFMKEIILIVLVTILMSNPQNAFKEFFVDNTYLNYCVKNDSMSNNVKTIDLYYPDDQAQYLLSSSFELKNDINVILDNLIKYDKNYFPKNFKIVDCKVQNSIAHVTLNDTLDSLPSRGDLMIYLNIEAIVFTLCLNDLNIESVKFYVENKETNLIGPVCIDDPFTPNKELISE